MPRQCGDVLAPLAERRQPHGKDGNAVPEILAELPGGHHARQVAMRGGHDPHVHVLRLLRADAFQPPVLQDPQQPHLRGQGQLADFVQQQRAAVGPLEPALPRLNGAGEGPALVAEELRIDQFAGNGPAIDAQEGPRRPRRMRVNHAGDQFFSGAGLTHQEDRGIGAGHQFDALAGPFSVRSPRRPPCRPVPCGPDA